MKAIRVSSFGGPEVLKYEEIPSPQPAHGEVLIRVRAIGVNPVDTYIRSGAYAAKPELPYTPGTDAAGEVIAVGDGVHHVKAGDRVYTTGTMTGAYAELALCSSDQVWPLPLEVTFAQGAALSVPYSTAYKSLFIRAKAHAGETVLVHGATGGVGLAAVQFARAAGLRVFGTGGTPEGLRALSVEGPHLVFDHKSADYFDKIMAATEGRGVDIVLEMLANVNLQKDLNLLAKFGRIVIIGSRGKVEIDPRSLMRSEGQILSTMSSTSEERATAQAAIRAGLQARTLHPLISKEFPLSQAAVAHQAVMDSKSPGKIILDPTKG
jgi:NADPH2:quinone reductase